MADASGIIQVLGVIPEEPTGVNYVRFFQPFEHLQEDGFALRTLGSRITLARTAEGYAPDRSTLDGISLLIFPQMVVSPALPGGGKVNLVGPLCREAKDRGIPIVYSVDDYLPAIEKENPEYGTIRESIRNLETILKYADAVFVTTPTLKAAFQDRGLPVFVLPNCVDPDKWRDRSGRSGELRIGWAGSSSHLEDLRMILPALKATARHIRFTFQILGLIDMPMEDQVRQIRSLNGRLDPGKQAAADAFLAFHEELGSLRFRHQPFTGMDRYFRGLAALDLDLGLCPLRDTPFNRNKSALKFYEYAMAGTCSLASRVTPYKEEVTALADNTLESWTEELLRFTADPDLRTKELYRQQSFVLKRRNIKTVRNEWKAALSRLLRR